MFIRCKNKSSVNIAAACRRCFHCSNLLQPESLHEGEICVSLVETRLETAETTLRHGAELKLEATAPPSCGGAAAEAQRRQREKPAGHKTTSCSFPDPDPENMLHLRLGVRLSLPLCPRSRASYMDKTTARITHGSQESRTFSWLL